MSTVAEFASFIEAAERKGIPQEPESRHIAVAILNSTAGQIANALWQADVKPQALAIAERFRALADKIDEAERAREIAVALTIFTTTRENDGKASTKYIDAERKAGRIAAAASELLEALDNAAAALETLLATYGDEMPEGDQMQREKVLAEARAAIAKATGEST